MNQKKQAAISINKVIYMALGAVLLIIIISGTISGGLNPLFKNIGARMDNALAKLGIWTDETETPKSNDGCQAWEDAEEISSEAKFRFCTSYCELEYDNLYTLDRQQGKFLKGTQEVSSLLSYNADIKNKWNGIHSMKNFITPEGGEAHGELIKIYGPTKTKRVIVRENITRKIQADHTIENLVSRDNWLVSLVSLEKYEYNWETEIEGAPYLNPEYSLNDLQKIKQAYNYFEEHCI